MERVKIETAPERLGLNRTIKAVRSGLRRYPREVLNALRDPGHGHHQPHLSEILHELAPHELATTWLGHGSVVVQVEDRCVAVDPVLSHRIGVRMGRRTIGPARQMAAPIMPEALRGVDLVLITHAHFDHLDKPTLRHIATRATTVIVPHGCVRLIPRGFKNVIPVGPGESATVDELTVHAFEPRHWGARTIVDRHRGVNSYLVESAATSVFLAGDTAHTEAFDALGPVDLAVFGIGAYDPWIHMHANPEQVWSMFSNLGGRFLLPVHHSTFVLSDEPKAEPMERLVSVAGHEGRREQIIESEPGEVFVLPSSAT